MFECVHGLNPPYLKELFINKDTPYTPPHNTATNFRSTHNVRTEDNKDTQGNAEAMEKADSTRIQEKYKLISEDKSNHNMVNQQNFRGMKRRCIYRDQCK